MYEEARLVLGASPRSAAALLRLVVQQLTMHLGKPGTNLNADIGSLVADGLPVKVQQALDIVRVVGNHSIHPGQIDVGDDRESALQLFNLVNLIVDVMITQPAAVEAMFQSLPPGSREQVQQRDAAPDSAASDKPPVRA